MATNGVNGSANGHHLPALHTSAEDFLKHDYDYIVIGGGTAGLVVAARLTENEDVTVGVLEAGKSKLGDMLVDSPVAFMQMFMNKDYDWCFMTEPQENNKGRRHHIPRGKALGGSSAINYMMYVRGSLQDYDDWAIISGDESWNAENILKYMRKHQTLEPIDDSVTDRSTMPFVGEYHGTSGPARTSFNDFRLPIEDDFIKACDDATKMTKKPKDPWSGDHIGFYNTLGLVARSGPNKGMRSYAARGYFAANASRPNLHVLCDAMVQRIELEGDVATGVTFKTGGKEFTVKTKREVLVAGGAIQSPQILELSGIGDPEVLKAAGVEVKIENKSIGNNFQDHCLTAGVWEVQKDVMTLEAIHNPQVMEAAQKQLAETGGGPLTSVCTMQGFFPYKLFATQEEQDRVVKSIEADLPNLSPYQRKQYERTLAHLKDDKSANLQVVLIPSRFGMEAGIEDQSGVFPPPSTADYTPAISGAMCLQYPLSRGSVHIKTSNPEDHPTIDPAFLKHPADVDVLAAGLKMLGAVEKSPHLRDKITSRVFPPPEADMSDTEQMRQAVREICMSEYHVCGSVAMGEAVDSKLKVYGTRNVRVVDASVFPNHVSGNIVSSVYAVAEKAADIIKEEHLYGALRGVKT
ncbi:GMC oxidoreductase [Zasmidium cellare ATCC 36951]|uniref:GMC oxidoreductase n=1 Tax=Zasmidium cellare ATCC 36951 TaxID=1080233 RepID=A0A6A6CRS6_ZASCE|nr:GMC oxidoreductase [Zasmidium cellare ATCC 36951]KAF2168878.1 GMC oxidoreductase [Zasmidium cellare ATCC 36951]